MDEVTAYGLNQTNNVGYLGLRKDNFGNSWFVGSLNQNVMAGAAMRNAWLRGPGSNPPLIHF